MILQTLVYIIFLSVVYLLLAKSFELVYKTSGVFNIVHAFTVSFAAYVSFSVGKHFSDSLVISIPLAILASTLLMTIIELLFVRPLTKTNIAGWKTMVVTLALYYVLQNCLKIIYGDSNLPFHNWQRDTAISIFDFRISLVQIITIIVSLFLFVGLFVVSEKTLLGKRIKAISLNSELGTIVGVKKKHVLTCSFMISCVLASLAGICVAADTQISPNFGLNWFFLGVVVTIIGGMGKMRHVIFGALLLATAQHLSNYFFDSKWMNATAYIILVVFLYFRPFGFSGKKLKKTEV